MELPINDKELATIVSALRLGGDIALYQKLNIVKDLLLKIIRITIRQLLKKDLDLFCDGNY